MADVGDGLSPVRFAARAGMEQFNPTPSPQTYVITDDMALIVDDTLVRLIKREQQMGISSGSTSGRSGQRIVLPRRTACLSARLGS